MKIAIPTNNPGGLEAARSEHFGHCDVFTVVSLSPEKNIDGIDTIANYGHEAGGCMVPVKILQDADVQAIVVGGMGARPMQGFAQVGIDVYFAGSEAAGDVQSVIKLFVEGLLPRMHPTQVCKGSGDCHH